MKPYVEILSRSLLFSGVSQNELICMLKCLGVIYKNYTKGEYILKAGDKIDSVGIIVSGSAEIIKKMYLQENNYGSPQGNGLFR